MASEEKRKLLSQENYEASTSQQAEEQANATSIHSEKLKSIYLASFVSTLGLFTLPVTFSWVSPIILRENYQIAHVTISILGAFTLGGFCTLPVSDEYFKMYGKKKLLLFLLAPHTLGWLLIAISPLIVLVLIGKFFIGFSSIGFLVTSIAYISEISDINQRGEMLSIVPLTISIGTLFSYVIMILTSYEFLSWLNVILPLILALIFTNFPESPLQDLDNANSSLKVFYGENSPIVDSIIHNLTDYQNNGSKIKNYMKLCVSIMIIFSFTFGNAIETHAQLIVTTRVFSSSFSILILTSICQIIGNLIGQYLIDKKGRCYLLNISLILTIISYFLSALYIQLIRHYYFNLALVRIIDFNLFLFMFFVIVYSMGVGLLPFVLLGEVFFKNLQWSVFTILFAVFLNFFTIHYFTQIYYFFGRDIYFYSLAILTFLFKFYLSRNIFETNGKTFGEIHNLINQNKIENI